MKHKKDENHDEVIKALLQLGCSVFDLYKVGDGMTDLLVGYRGLNFLVEVKRDEKASFTPMQIRFNATWRGSVIRANSPLDAVEKVIKASNTIMRLK